MAEFFNVIMLGEGVATEDVRHTPVRLGGKKTAPIFGKDPKTGKFQLIPVPEGKGAIQFRKGRTYQFPVGVRVKVTDEMKKIQREITALNLDTLSGKFTRNDPRPRAEEVRLTNELKEARGRAVRAAIADKHVDFQDGFKKVNVLKRSYSPDGSLVNKIESVTPVPSAQYEGVFKVPSSPYDPGDLLPAGEDVDPEDTPKGRRRLERRSATRRASPLEEGLEVGGKAEADFSLDPDELAKTGTSADPDAKTPRSAYDRLSDDNKRRVNRGLVPINEDSGVEMDTTYMDEDLKARIDENAASRRAKRTTAREGRKFRIFEQRQSNVLKAIGSKSNTPKELRDRVAAYKEQVAKVKNSDLSFKEKQKALNGLLVKLRQDTRRDLAGIASVNKGQAEELRRYRENIKRAFGQGNKRTSFVDRDTGRVLRPFRVEYESGAKATKKGDTKGLRGGKVRSITVFADSADAAMDRVSEIGDYVAAPGDRAGMVNVSQLDDANLDDITPGAKGSKPLVIDPETGDLVTDREAAARSKTNVDVDKPRTTTAASAADDVADAIPAKTTAVGKVADEASDLAKVSKGGRISQALGIAGKTGLGRLGALAFGPLGTAVGLGFMAYGAAAAPQAKRREKAARDRAALERYYQISSVRQQQDFERKALQERATAARSMVAQKTRVKLSPELEAVLGVRRNEFIKPTQAPAYKPDQLDMYRNLIR